MLEMMQMISSSKMRPFLLFLCFYFALLHFSHMFVVVCISHTNETKTKNRHKMEKQHTHTNKNNNNKNITHQSARLIVSGASCRLSQQVFRMRYVDVVAFRSIQEPAFHGLGFTFHRHKTTGFKVERFIKVFTVA